MSHTDDTNPNRGRPVLMRVNPDADYGELQRAAQKGALWTFIGEFEGSEQKAVDAAYERSAAGIFKVFPSGSWPGGYLRD